ncbi:hypothetical protein [Lysinibacillus sp. G01H]|uniref:hypothetical protein n=1 Tax=Lysinibacillus sp. G01H TaxID=3026425 RepID=UPI00237DB48F|nr:hypothetical protein [Lysinibacillus sp. G01H]WDU80053.1 hypothetical protein PSR12_02595 [Lysinibacillus sp. G01H]
MFDFQAKVVERMLKTVEANVENIINCGNYGPKQNVDYNDPKRKEEVDRHTREALDRMGR